MPNNDNPLDEWLRDISAASLPEPPLWITAPDVNLTHDHWLDRIPTPAPSEGVDLSGSIGTCGNPYCNAIAYVWNRYEDQGEDPEAIRCGDHQPRECSGCSEMINSDDICIVGQNYYCTDCRENDCWLCDGHDEWHEDSWENTRIGNELYCNSEVANRFWWCDNCDEWVGIGYECAACEESEPSRGVDYLQVDCDCRVPNTKPIHNYSCKPPLTFFGSPSNKLFIGLELETEVRRKLSEGAVYMNEALGEFGQLKSDGSIGYDENRNQRHQGFEIVTMPVDLAGWQDETGFFESIEYLRKNFDARAWDGQNCGIHLHLSRDAFEAGSHIHRFLKLAYGNAQTFSKFAGRVNPNYATWGDCTTLDHYGQSHITFANKMERQHTRRNGYDRNEGYFGARGERHSAINLTNRDTIELRFFRGNLRKEGILRNIELAHAMVEYTRGMAFKDVQLGLLDWEWFEAYINDNNGLYPNAYNRIQNVRGLSVNDKTLIEA